jgi:hypothetical protein
MHRVDEIIAIKDKEEMENQLWGIKEESIELMNSTVCDKKDLDWKEGSVWKNSPRVMTGLLRYSLR